MLFVVAQHEAKKNCIITSMLSAFIRGKKYIEIVEKKS
jgi:hypothetical protein